MRACACMCACVHVGVLNISLCLAVAVAVAVIVAVDVAAAVAVVVDVGCKRCGWVFFWVSNSIYCIHLMLFIGTPTACTLTEQAETTCKKTNGTKHDVP